MDNVTALNNHIEFKRTSVKSKAKLQDIKRYLTLFFNSTKTPLNKVGENHLIKFLNSLDYSIRTINDIKTYIKVFVKWHYPDWSSRFRNLDKICKQQKPQRSYEPEQMLSFEEVEKLVKGEKDLMYKVYWLVLFYGGFRPSEACDLKWNQIFFEEKGVIIKIRASKTGKDFYKSLPDNTEHLLKEWKKYNKSEFVFPSPITNSSIKARSVCKRLKTLSKNVLGKKVVPYQLRHSIATILYRDDKRKDDDSANQLGHSKSMKEIYMNLDEDTIKAKARMLWTKTKPLTPEERDKLEMLEKEIEKMKENQNTLFKQFDLIIEVLNKGRKITGIQKLQEAKVRKLIFKKGLGVMARPIVYQIKDGR